MYELKQFHNPPPPQTKYVAAHRSSDPLTWRASHGQYHTYSGLCPRRVPIASYLKAVAYIGMKQYTLVLYYA